MNFLSNISHRINDSCNIDFKDTKYLSELTTFVNKNVFLKKIYKNEVGFLCSMVLETSMLSDQRKIDIASLQKKENKEVLGNICVLMHIHQKALHYNNTHFKQTKSNKSQYQSYLSSLGGTRKKRNKKKKHRRSRRVSKF